jgi:hypothetical protein
MWRTGVNGTMRAHGSAQGWSLWKKNAQKCRKEEEVESPMTLFSYVDDLLWFVAVLEFRKDL